MNWLTNAIKNAQRALSSKKPGFIGGIDVGGILISIIVVGFIILMFTIVAGRAYSTQEASITAISDANVEASVKATAINVFASFQDVGSQLTLFTILAVLLVVVAIAAYFRNAGNMGGYGGQGYGRVM